MTGQKSALGEQGRLMTAVLGQMADGVIVADEAGRLLIYNAAAERILGVGPTDATPDQWAESYGLFLPDAITPYPADQIPPARGCAR